MRDHRPARLGIPFAALVGAAVVALFTLDVFTLRCDRTTQRCTWSSTALAGRSSGILDLRSIERLTTDPTWHRGAQVNEVYLRVQHHAVMRDGSTVPLERFRRTSMIGEETLPRRFERFRQRVDRNLAVTEVHFGFGGLVVVVLLMIAGVFGVLARRVTVSVEQGALTFSRAGVIGGWRSWSGPVEAIRAVELNRGSYAGLYLRTEDGDRLKVRYGGVDAETEALAEQLAHAVGRDVTTTTDAEVRKTSRGTNPLPALGCMLLAFSPLAVPCGWGIASSLAAELLR